MTYSLISRMFIDPPCFSAYKDAIYALPTSGYNSVTNWTEAIDSAAMFDPVTGLAVLPQSGYYMLNASILFQTSAVGRRILQIESGVAATGSNKVLIRQEATPGGYLGLNIARDMVPLLKGETLRVAVYQTSGGSLDSKADWSPTTFSVRRVH